MTEYFRLKLDNTQCCPEWTSFSNMLRDSLVDLRIICKQLNQDNLRASVDNLPSLEHLVIADNYAIEPPSESRLAHAQLLLQPPSCNPQLHLQIDFHCTALPFQIPNWRMIKWLRFVTGFDLALWTIDALLQFMGTNIRWHERKSYYFIENDTSD